MNQVLQKILARLTKKKALTIFLALFISLPIFTFQILPLSASYQQTADVKNKKVSYKETRERKHGKNKSNLKNQVVTSGLVLNLDASNIDNMSTAASNLTTATTWTDLSGNGNNGTLNNFTLPTSTTTSGWDRANTGLNPAPSVLKFDGSNDYVDVGTPSSLNINGNVTICAWVKFNNLSMVTFIASQAGSDGSGGQYWLESGRTANKVAFAWENTTFLNSSTSLSTGTWYYVCGVRNGSTGSWSRYLYLNGALDATDTISTDPGIQRTFAVGKLGGHPNYYHSGSVANVRVYNVALTSDQIRQNYLAEVSNFPDIKPSNPVISSATLNGNSIPISSPYRITNNDTLKLDFSSMDYYSSNQTTLSCNPPAGRFSSSPSFNSTANLTFTPDATNVGMTYSYTVMALSDSGTAAASSLAFSVIVTCSSDTGCPSGQACRQGVCCAPCPYNSNICDDGGISATYSAPVLNLDAANIDNMGTVASSSTTTTTWTDLSGYGNNGTLNSFTLPTGGSASGWDGTNISSNPSTLKFDGTNDYVNVPESSSLDITGNITLYAWVNRTDVTKYVGPIAKRTTRVGSTPQIQYQLYWAASTDGMAHKLVFPINNETVVLTGANSHNVTGWHNIAATFDGSIMKVYFDGILDGSLANTAAINHVTSPVVIGYDNDGTFLTQQTANVRIYNIALTPYQIYQNYLADYSRYGVTATTPPAFMCNASLVPLPPLFTPALTSQPSSTSTPINTSTPTPTPTPVQNITNTNSGNTTSSQGVTVSSPSINTAPTNTNIPRPFIDVSMHGIVQPEIPKTTGIDLSVLKNKPVKTDSANASYIDISKSQK